jgi:hypothetical protein
MMDTIQNKKYNFIYKTTNLTNGEFYIGMHATNNLNDGYLGSGYRLKSSIRKHGKENFEIEYLEFFENYGDLRDSERKLVNEELLKDPNCINLVFGGGGGFISPKGAKKGGVVAGEKHSEKMKNPEYKKRVSENVSKFSKERFVQEGENFPLLKYRYDWKGKKHSSETITKQKESKKNHGKGCNNSQYGTCWITNEIQNRKINKIDPIPEGWRFGRKIIIN